MYIYLVPEQAKHIYDHAFLSQGWTHEDKCSNKGDNAEDACPENEAFGPENDKTNR